MKLPVYLEIADKKLFAVAVEWPGWSRSGKDEATAIDTLLAYAPRYVAAVARAGVGVPLEPDEADIVERIGGGSGTAFGVPSSTAGVDTRPTSDDDAARLAALVEAAWATFDEVAAAAPEALRKGPRGGGRDRSKIVGHHTEADAAYATQIGLKLRPAVPTDRAGVAAMRAAMLDVLRKPSDGSPLGGRRWTQRYAARRIAWHALDHAWEIEDRTER